MTKKPPPKPAKAVFWVSKSEHGAGKTPKYGLAASEKDDGKDENPEVAEKTEKTEKWYFV